MSIADDIQAQLEELWENADPGPFKEGDAVIINRFGRADFEVRHRVEHDGENLNTRVLERAPRPKPRPRAVLASSVSDPGRREAYAELADGSWESSFYAVEADELVDPVELVPTPSKADLEDVMGREWSRAGGWPGTDRLSDAVLELLER